MTPRTNIGRRMEILACLLDHESRSARGMGVVVVAERLQREKSQISRGLSMLAQAGLVERDPETREFSIGPRLLAVAARAGDPDLVERAWPVLGRLAAQLGERSNLSGLHDGCVLTIDTAGAASTVQTVGWSGRLTPVHCTAAGRALTMELGEAELRLMLGGETLPVAGPRSPATLTELLERVAVARSRGVAVTDGELDADVLGVAAPVRDAAGSVRASIGISGPAFRLRARLDEAQDAVLAAAREVAAGLA